MIDDLVIFLTGMAMGALFTWVLLGAAGRLR